MSLRSRLTADFAEQTYRTKQVEARRFEGVLSHLGGFLLILFVAPVKIVASCPDWQVPFWSLRRASSRSSVPWLPILTSFQRSTILFQVGDIACRSVLPPSRLFRALRLASPVRLSSIHFSSFRFGLGLLEEGSGSICSRSFGGGVDVCCRVALHPRSRNRSYGKAPPYVRSASLFLAEADGFLIFTALFRIPIILCLLSRRALDSSSESGNARLLLSCSARFSLDGTPRGLYMS